MIKIVFRVVIILLVAVLLSAGLFALVQNSSARIGFNNQRQFNPSANAGASSARPEGFRGEGRDFRGGASLVRGLGGILVGLLQIGAITFVVLQFQKALKTPRSTS
jgi:hypothetical protein